KKEERQAEGPSTCEQPFMMINDLGLTFGHTSVLNWNKPSSVNLENWAKTPIWLHNTGCEAKLKKSASGTLFDPYISEGGRVFLLNLLTQLSDQQLADLFKTARFDERPRNPEHADSTPASIDEWVSTFKEKRDEIANRHCDQ